MFNRIFKSNLAYFLTVSLLVVSCSGGNDGAAKDSATQTTTNVERLSWDISLWGKKRAGTELAEAFKEIVERETSGAWQVELHYGEALSKARENLDGLVINAFEGAMFCNFYHPQKNPALMVLSLPFLPMESVSDAVKVREAVYRHPDVIEQAARWNAHLYASSQLPQYEFMGRGEPPINLTDWQGLTVRAGGGIGQAMILLGATPTSATATEVYTGVQQGTMDAASFPFTYAHVSYRIHEVSTWFTSNFSPGSADCALAFSLDAYNRLSEEDRSLLTRIKHEVVNRQLQAYVDVDRVNLPMLRNELQEIMYSDAQLAEFEDTVGIPVIEAWIEQNQDDFDARGLVETVFTAVGKDYE